VVDEQAIKSVNPQ